MARRNVGAVPWAEVTNVEIAGRPAAAAGNLWDDDCAPASADWPLRAAVAPLLELAWRGLAGPGGTVARAEGRAGPGGRAKRSGRLRPWCSRPERERRGKCGVLRVLLCCHGALRCCSKYLHAAQTPAARPLCASHCAARTHPCLWEPSLDWLSRLSLWPASVIFVNCRFLWSSGSESWGSPPETPAYVSSLGFPESLKYLGNGLWTQV